MSFASVVRTLRSDTRSGPTHMRCTRRRPTTCAIKARWCLDIRYGSKMDAVELLQEWVQDIGAAAGLTPSNSAISSGSVGVPESRLELEVVFDTLAELELFWAAIPPTKHKAWSQRLQPLVVHGSPTWEVYRTVESFPGSEVAVASGEAGGMLVMPSEDEVGQYSAGVGPSLPSTARTTSSGLAVVGSAEEADQILDWNGAVDWKGEPMIIRPGDRMPGGGQFKTTKRSQ